MLFVLALVFFAVCPQVTFAKHNSSDSEKEIEKAQSASKGRNLVRQAEIDLALPYQTLEALGGLEAPSFCRPSISPRSSFTPCRENKRNGSTKPRFQQSSSMDVQCLQNPHERLFQMLWELRWNMETSYGSIVHPANESIDRCMDWLGGRGLEYLHQLGRLGYYLTMETQIPTWKPTQIAQIPDASGTTARQTWQRSGKRKERKKGQRSGPRERQGKRRQTDGDSSGACMATSSCSRSPASGACTDAFRDAISTASACPSKSGHFSPEPGSARDPGHSRQAGQSHRSEDAVFCRWENQPGTEAIAPSPDGPNKSPHQLEHALVGKHRPLAVIHHGVRHDGCRICGPDQCSQRGAPECETNPGGTEGDWQCIRATNTDFRSGRTSRCRCGQNRQCQLHPTGIADYGHLAGGAAEADRGNASRTQEQASSHCRAVGGCQRRGRGRGQRFQFGRSWKVALYGYAAFWRGSVIDFSEITDPALSAFGRARVQQWTHPVTQHLDFTAPWQAAEAAAELAWSLGQLQWSCPLPIHMSPGPCRAHGPVHFNPKIEVLLGEEDAIHMTSSSILHQDLQQWPGKPWSLDGRDDLCIFQSPDIDVCGALHSELVQPEHLSQGVPGLGLSSSTCCTSTHYGILRCPSQESSRLSGLCGHSHGPCHSSCQKDLSATPDLPEWIHNLRQKVLIPQTDVDPHGDEHGVALITWYLDHRRHRACYASRMLWLRDETQYWEEDIINTWQDLFLQGRDYNVFLVHPEPPRSTLQFHQAHLLLVQNEGEECSILLSTLIDRHPGPKQIAQAAFAVSCWTNADLVLRTFRPDPHVTLETSWIYRDDDIIQHAPVLLRSGDSVVIHQSLRRPLDDESLLDRHRIRLMEHELGNDDEDDFSGFMQRSMQEQLARAILQAGQPAEGPLAQIQDFTFDNSLQCIGAQASTPAAPPTMPPNVLPQAMVNLQTFFQQQAATAAVQQDHVVTTWYLNHVTSLTCHRPRIVALGNDPTAWARHIVNAWRDMIDDGFPFRFYVVRPTPPAFERQPAQPHILLVQQPSNHLRSVIISASHVQNHPGQYVRWAAAIPAPVGKETVVHAANAMTSCTPLTDHNLCQIWWGSHLLDQPQEVHNGASIVMLVALLQEAPTPQLNTPDEDDVVWLSQRHTTFSTATNIRVPEQASAPLSAQAVSSTLFLVPDFDVNRLTPEEDDVLSFMAANHERPLDSDAPLLEQEGIARNIDSPADGPADDPQGDLDVDVLPEQDLDVASDTEDPGMPAGPPPPSAADLTRYASVIYSINAPPVHARLPYGVRNTFYEAAAAAMQVSERAIVLLHSMPHPPADIESSQVTPMICQMVGELTEGAIHRYVLTDVEFHAAMPVMSPEVQRSTQLLPRQLTRSQILRINAVHQYCERAERSTTGCLLWHNNQLIPNNFRGHLNLFHGDYIRIALPPDTRTADEYSTHEMAAICWTGDSMFTDLGAEGRAFLPDVLPQVPPNTSTVYTLPGILYDDEEAMLQLGIPTHKVTPSTTSQAEVSGKASAGIPRVLQLDCQLSCSDIALQDRSPLRDVTNFVGEGPGDPTLHRDAEPHITNAMVDHSSPGPHVEAYDCTTFEGQLHRLLRDEAFNHCKLADGSVLVHTWYLDHHRIPNQEEDRLVYLGHDPALWRQQILDEWRDLALPQNWALLSIATPAPDNRLQGQELHILVTQTPDLGTSSILLSVDFPPEAAGFSYRIAVAHSRIASRSTIHNAARCPEVQVLPDMKCTQVTFDNTRWSPHRLYPVEDGHHIQIQVDKETLVAPVAPPETEISPTVPFDLSEEEDHTLHSIGGTSTSTSTSDAGHGQSPHKRARTLCLSTLIPATQTHYKSLPKPSDTTGTRGVVRTPVALQLDPVIPRPTAGPHDDEVHLLWFEEHDWKVKIFDDLHLQLHQLPDGLRVPDSTYDLLRRQPVDFSASPFHIELYLDGSAGDHGAGWSVVAIITNGIEERFLGCIWGPVALASDDPAWLGADSTDNISAEFTAFAHAQLLAAFFGDFVVVLRPDLALSRTVASGNTTCKSNPRLAKLLRNLQRWSHGHHYIHEVRGHTGHPWNDLADALAKFSVTNPVPHVPPSFQTLQRFLREEHDHNWAWLQGMPTSFSACMPPTIGEVGMQFAPSLRKCTMPTKTTSISAPTSVHLVAVTANVLALESTREIEDNHLVGRIGGNRTARLDAQMHQRGVHVVGLQEARSREGRFNSEHYTIFASGALKKRAPLYGCEIWIHKSLEVLHPATGSAHKLAEAKHTVLHSDPRRLLISCELPGMSLVLGSLHAPCLGKHTPGEPHPLEQIADWWQESSEILQKNSGGRPVLIMVDANAPVTDRTSDFTGAHHPDKHAATADIFFDFIEMNSLYIPSTFASIHRGPSATWTHSSGNATRRDYILISKDLFQMIQYTQVLTDHDTAFAHEDHLPVLAQLSGWTMAPHDTSRPPLDQDRMLDPDACRQFQAALQTLPLPTWDTDIDHHCAVLSSQIIDLAEQHFARPKQKTKRFKLSETTVEIIALKRQALDYARAHSLITHPELKREIKELELMIRPLVAQDVKAHYDALIEQAKVSGDIVNPKLMYRLLRRLGGKKTKQADRPLPKLHNADGNPVQSYQEQQQLWMEKFAATEAGTQVSWDALEVLNRQGRLNTVQIHDPLAFSTLWGLQDSAKKLKRGKVPGPDGISPDLIKAGGDVLLQCLIPLMTKATAHAREPLSWKGGFVTPLWKGKLSPTSSEAYRSIFISSFVAKLYHQQIRSHLVSCWEAKIAGLQFGGRRNHGTDTAHHCADPYGMEQSQGTPYSGHFL